MSAPLRPTTGIWRREVRRIVGGVLNVGAAWVLNRGRGAFSPALTLDAFRALPAVRPLDAARLLAGRTNPDRARVLETVLATRGWPVTRAPYRTLEGAGTNLLVDFGPRPRTLILAAHHDAVPGSPGANDNAASVGLLLAVGERLAAHPPRRLRVRLAFFGGEERAMLGSRVFVRRTALDEVLGVLSLELCGIGDSLALWDVSPAIERTALVRAWVATAEALGYRRDDTYHLTEPVPFFGSDHRPFADRGVPGVGLTVVPRAAVPALRAFIYGGIRGILIPPARRPPPFTTYHTADDRPETLDPAALDRVETLLIALCRALDAPGGAA
jgi:hypothetical protein